MYERILQRFRHRIRSLEYVVPLHAEEEMDEDGLSVFDLESAVLGVDPILRQKMAFFKLVSCTGNCWC